SLADPAAFVAFPVAAGFIVAAFELMHRARRDLAYSRDLHATTLESIGDGVVVTDAAGRVTFLNAEAERLTGWRNAEAQGRPLAEVFRIVDEPTRQAAASPAEQVLREGLVVGLANHTLLLARDGREIPIDDSAAPIRDGQGGVVGAVLVFRDVTARRQSERALQQVEEQLRRRVEDLAEASRRKSEFMATLAHELRNPLAPIRNSITLLQLKGPPDSELTATRDVIDRQVQHMSRLLDDLLDVNRLGRHRLQLRKERVTLESVVKAALETARPQIEAGRHQLLVHLPAEKVLLDADPMRLAQVFSNLLGNSAKYTEPGGRIQLSAAREGSEVLVSVRDSGIGIAPEALGSLFEMFMQVPGAMGRAQGGAGIGLALARGLVELHGGTITAHSDGPGQGSLFTVRLPVAAGAAPPDRTPGRAPARMRPSLPARRILIADDVHDNADTLAMMLRALGHEVHVTYDGEAAVAAAERLRPEVALLDIGMPRLNGYDACRQIRQQPWGREIVLVAQTGWGQEEDRRKSDEAGFDRHLVKPVDSAALLAVLAELPRTAAR
ncbi:MAG TPA: ATP-binding protein, partial [Planctomycetota bacterium]|nr:ATP-binding protein [Planctomycetota bacterium]